MSFDEFSVGFGRVEEAKKQFERLDTNGDGKISVDVFKAEKMKK